VSNNYSGYGVPAPLEVDLPARFFRVLQAGRKGLITDTEWRQEQSFALLGYWPERRP
jgi:hypothetical protein